MSIALREELEKACGTNKVEFISVKALREIVTISSVSQYLELSKLPQLSSPDKDKHRYYRGIAEIVVAKLFKIFAILVKSDLNRYIHMLILEDIDDEKFPIGEKYYLPIESEHDLKKIREYQ